jgi:hypothetical protein
MAGRGKAAAVPPVVLNEGQAPDEAPAEHPRAPGRVPSVAITGRRSPVALEACCGEFRPGMLPSADGAGRRNWAVVCRGCGNGVATFSVAV